MKNSTKLITLIAAGTSLAVSNLTFAATNGTVGDTSTGSIGITATIANQVRITGLDTDIVFGVNEFLRNSGDATSLPQNVCIYDNNDGKYYITASGSGAGGAFTLLGAGTNDTMTYNVEWYQDQNAGGTGTPLVANQKSTQFSGANVEDQNCNGTSNASFTVSIPAAVHIAAHNDTYTGTLTLVVEPT